MYWPDLLPAPVTILTTPAGSRSSISSIKTSTLKGVTEEGLKTTQLPAARAGASFQAAIRKGKFQGTIWPTTPRGSRSTRLIKFPSSILAEPSVVRMAPA